MNAPFARIVATLLALGLAGAAPHPSSPHLERVVLAGGCFWGMQAVFERLRGVTAVVAGYSGGSATTAHYGMVGTGTTGHAESIEVSYDPGAISLERLLTVFFTVAHDPTQLNRQGPDDGAQYRSAIFYADAAQRRIADAAIARLRAAHAFRAPIVTQVVPLTGFYPAEAYHQHFADRHPDNPYIVQVDEPKIAALRAKYGAWLKPSPSSAMRTGAG